MMKREMHRTDFFKLPQALHRVHRIESEELTPFLITAYKYKKKNYKHVCHLRYKHAYRKEIKLYVE